jgi:hypothetical protein
MVKPVETVSDSQSLRKLLHEKIERLDAGQLSLLNRVLLQLEVEDLAERLDTEFDLDRKAGKLSPDRIQKVLSLVRQEHNYR